MAKTATAQMPARHTKNATTWRRPPSLLLSSGASLRAPSIVSSAMQASITTTVAVERKPSSVIRATIPETVGPFARYLHFQGIAPTGKEVAFSSMEFNRVVYGKVEVHWVELDLLGLMQQLGAIPEPGEPEPT
jgi:hypothetical protein